MIKLQHIKENLAPEVQKIIVAYPGRFQIFGPHHNEVYNILCNNYGVENTYILTTNKVEWPSSPFNFYEKREVMNMYGIDNKYICEVKYPYAPIELINRFDLNKTALFLALGKKDLSRFERKFFKKDGERAHIQDAATASKYNSVNKNSYIIEVPHIEKYVDNIGEMSGTVLRNILKSGNIDLFESITGWYEPSLYNKLYQKITGDSSINESSGKIKLTPLVMPIYMK